jgi:hypothetical protein
MDLWKRLGIKINKVDEKEQDIKVLKRLKK